MSLLHLPWIGDADFVNFTSYGASVLNCSHFHVLAAWLALSLLTNVINQSHPDGGDIAGQFFFLF